MGGLFGHALLGWVITAVPLLLLLTVLLTPFMHWVARRAAEQ